MIEAYTPRHLRACLMLAINLALGFLMFTRMSDWGLLFNTLNRDRDRDRPRFDRGCLLDTIANGVTLGNFRDYTCTKGKLVLTRIASLTEIEITRASTSARVLDEYLTTLVPT